MGDAGEFELCLYNPIAIIAEFLTSLTLFISQAGQTRLSWLSTFSNGPAGADFVVQSHVAARTKKSALHAKRIVEPRIVELCL